MEFRCIKIRLYEGQRERAINWMRAFGARADEAVEAMRGNGLRHEVVFLDDDDQGDYLLIVQASDDFTATTRAFLQSELLIDREALAVLAEIGDRGQQLEVLIQLDVDD